MKTGNALGGPESQKKGGAHYVPFLENVLARIVNTGTYLDNLDTRLAA